MQFAFVTLAVVGAGAMGRGIAQIAAQAGTKVHLFDNQSEAANKAISAIAAVWDKQVDKGKLTPGQAAAFKTNLLPCTALADLATCDLVIEAIAERLDVKQGLFAQLEAIVPASCVLASNTSSLSITAIAAGCSTLGALRATTFLTQCH